MESPWALSESWTSRAEGILIVEIAGNGRGGIRAFEHLAQRRAGCELARLQHEEGGGRRSGEQLVQRLGMGVGGFAQPQHAPAAGERKGRRLIGQARRIVLQLGGRQFGNAEGIGRVARNPRHQIERRARAPDPDRAHKTTRRQPSIPPIAGNGPDRALRLSSPQPPVGCHRLSRRSAAPGRQRTGLRYRRRGVSAPRRCASLVDWMVANSSFSKS